MNEHLKMPFLKGRRIHSIQLQVKSLSESTLSLANWDWRNQQIRILGPKLQFYGDNWPRWPPARFQLETNGVDWIYEILFWWSPLPGMESGPAVYCHWGRR